MKTSDTPSIRRRLLSYLLAPLLLLLVLGVAVDHQVIVNPIYSTFDRSLSRAALAIAAHIRRTPDGQLDIPIPDRPPAPLRAPPQEKFFYRVSTLDGNTIAGDAQLPIVAAGRNSKGLDYADVTYQGLQLRLVSYRTTEAGEPLVVSAAEIPFRRDRAVHRMDVSFGINNSIQMLLMLGTALLGITIALRPLRRLREQIVGCAPQALNPISTAEVPAEVRPLVDSLNTLLVSVRDATLAQQHFLANAAHQLRTPLTGLKAQLEVLGQEASGSPLQARITQLHGGIDRLAHTANQLLALARAEPSAHLASHFTQIELPALIGAVIGNSLDHALQRDIDLGADCQPAQVYGVYWLLRELLLNLLDNAIRHTPLGGHITLRCGIELGQPFLEVDDSGPGIPIAERERVRERFYHGTGSERDSCGLGLAIVDEAARAHGAHFSILDSHDCQGARMRIDFPAPSNVSPAGALPSEKPSKR
ncbi:sensor histidine kinase [Dyella tabacisoli]|uniref:histidine kinase n=1 Tax=Dyella tabacisoli TaxID=2282381 RepID=A0A369UQQ1_9GAMM|nr:sensor histidine kinase [Dyella tabacisoli]RDD82385.1 sensor histidine kinase [Dyella tabacisoli]